MELTSQALVQVLQIIWIDLLLSGDNAVVIALACRSLPPRQRRLGIMLGAGVAVASAGAGPDDSGDDMTMFLLVSACRNPAAWW